MRRQCELLSLCRSSLYYTPQPESEYNIRLMHKLDRLYVDYPYMGYRKLTVLLNRDGEKVNVKRVHRLLRQMGLMAIYPKPNLSKPDPDHKVYPYLLKGVDIIKPNQIWATDITYIRMKGGFCYLVAVIDWYSRYIVSWRLSSVLEVDFCVEALNEALAKNRPEIFNTDQGSQFTSHVFASTVLQAGVKLSMDGRGNYHDNIFTERFWRSVKYEEVYIRDYANFEEARKGLERYMWVYNNIRPHQALNNLTPAMVHYESSIEAQEICACA